MTQRRRPLYNEKLVDAWLVKCVKEAGGLCFKMHPMTNKGIPDRIIHIHGRTLYVETKSHGEKCTEAQIMFHKMLYEQGIQTYVLDTPIKNFYDLYIKAYKTYDEGLTKKNQSNANNTPE